MKRQIKGQTGTGSSLKGSIPVVVVRLHRRQLGLADLLASSKRNGGSGLLHGA